MSSVVSSQGRSLVNWRRVAAFVGLAYGPAWLLELALYLAGGLTHPATVAVLQTVMLMPALSALVLGMFVWRDSPLYLRTNRTATRWFFLYYLFMTAVCLLIALAGLFLGLSAQVLAGLTALPAGLSVLGLLLLLVLRRIGGKEAFAAVGMAGGKARVWLLFGVALGVFWGLQSLVLALLHLGKPVDLALITPAGMPTAAFLVVVFVQGVLLGPFLGLVITFGEDYGWRGYLQGELVKLGRVRGVALLGVIWGLWHTPMILMGYNYPGYPVLGTIMMTAFTVLLSFVLAYAMFKSGGFWIAAFLHALTNQTVATLMLVAYAPGHAIWGSPIGVLGLALGAVAVLLILRDPLWREKPAPAAEAGA